MKLDPVEGHPCYAFEHLRMIYLPDGLLFEDHLERRWESATGESVSEIIFPSRHVAASGQASLTLHPIGVPHLGVGEQGRYGGHGGRLHHPRRWPVWRPCCNSHLMETAVEGFDLSLEVTHHGPPSVCPACSR